MGASAREIIYAAAYLKEGDQIVTRCNNFDEMESLRTSLYRAKKAMMKINSVLAYSLLISREIRDDGWYVILAKEMTVTNVVIMRKDGTIEPFKRAEPAVLGNETENERVARLMREDGKSEEEISDTLAEMGEASFDKAAAKIEEAQGLVTNPGD